MNQNGQGALCSTTFSPRWGKTDVYQSKHTEHSATVLDEKLFYKYEHKTLNLARPQWCGRESNIFLAWKYEQVFSEVERKEKRFTDQEDTCTWLELSLSGVTNCLM